MRERERENDKQRAAAMEGGKTSERVNTCSKREREGERQVDRMSDKATKVEHTRGERR